MLEHYAGKFPVWLAPLQVKVLPISDKFIPYANEVKTKLVKAGIRVDVDERSEKIGKKIREAELSRVPYMLVIGEKEMNEGRLSVRRQGKGDTGSQAVDEFIATIVEEFAERKA